MPLPLGQPNAGQAEYGAPPDTCSGCGSVTWKSHGWINKQVKDLWIGTVRVRRIQCTDCGKTARVYPKGFTKRNQSEHLYGLSIFLWLLGLPYRGVVNVLAALHCRLSCSTVCENVQEFEKRLSSLGRNRLARRNVRILPKDKKHSQFGEPRLLVYLSNGEETHYLGIEVLPGEGRKNLRAQLRSFAEAVGLQILLNDEERITEQVSSGLRSRGGLYYAEESGTPLAEGVAELERLVGMWLEQGDKRAQDPAAREALMDLVSRLKHTAGFGSSEKEGA